MRVTSGSGYWIAGSSCLEKQGMKHHKILMIRMLFLPDKSTFLSKDKQKLFFIYLLIII